MQQCITRSSAFSHSLCMCTPSFQFSKVPARKEEITHVSNNWAESCVCGCTAAGSDYSVVPSTCLSFLQKRNKVFFPQKKVPEPISHLALSPPFGLTTKAHLCIYPCVLCTQNQQIYHLVLEAMVLSLLERTHFHTYFQSVAT